MEESDFKNINANLIFNTDLLQNQQINDNPQSPNQEKELNNAFENLLKKKRNTRCN